MKLRTELAVIGAGPAGLAAAIEAARHGVRVTVFDESPRPGGRLLLQLYEKPSSTGDGGWWIGRDVAAGLIRDAEALGVEIRCGTSVWGIFPGPSLAIKPSVQLSEDDVWSGVVVADKVLVASGASERALPLPGWTLPNVMSAGGMQMMINVYGVTPGQRILVVGADHLGMAVAMQLALVGIHVIAVALPPPGMLAGDRARPERVLTHLSHAAQKAAPTKVLRWLGHVVATDPGARVAARFYPQRYVRVWGVPLWLRQSVVELLGHDSVEEAVLAPLGRDGQPIVSKSTTIKVDAVCLSGGLTPLIELLAASGCQFVAVPELQGYVPLHGPHFETTVDGIHVAGSVTGVESAPAAVEQGRLAGLHLAAMMGRLSTSDARLALPVQERRLQDVRAGLVVDLNPDATKGRAILAHHWETKLNANLPPC